MLLKKDFYLIVNKLGLEDHELDFAALIWEKAEKAMQGKTNQEPALLTKPSVLQGKPALVHLPQVPARVVRGYGQHDFTRKELQQLRSYLSNYLFAYDMRKKQLKQAIQKIWLNCNPDDPTTKYNFEHLNTMKDLLRHCQKAETKLASLQSKLKKQLSTPA